jgi:peptide/nickel transport system substrate-binding protein
MKQFDREKSIPAGVFDLPGGPLVTEEEALARYEACDAWFKEKNLLIIGNGSFQLTRYDPPAQFAQLDAFRAEGYPFSAADFQLGVPPRLAIDPVTAPNFALGEPVSLQVKVNGPGTLSLQYTLIDPSAGATVTSGAAEPADAGTFNVNLDPNVTATLFPGVYQLYVLASSDAIAQVSEQRIDLNIGV